MCAVMDFDIGCGQLQGNAGPLSFAGLPLVGLATMSTVLHAGEWAVRVHFARRNTILLMPCVQYIHHIPL